MEFLGFDIYLVIVVIAAVMVGGIMFFMTKTIGRKPNAKKQVLLAAGKNKKLTGLKPRPALKAPAKKSAVTPVARPALKKRALVPVAAGSRETGEEQEDSSPDMVSEGKGKNAKAAKAKGKQGKPAEYNEDFGSTPIAEETEELPSQIISQENLDQPMDEIGEPENSMDPDAESNSEEANGPIENEGEPSTAPAAADLQGIEKKDTEDGPKPEGGLLDLFEEEEDEDSGNSLLASKLEDVESKSLEEIGKEISQSLFGKY